MKRKNRVWFYGALICLGLAIAGLFIRPYAQKRKHEHELMVEVERQKADQRLAAQFKEACGSFDKLAAMARYWESFMGKEALGAVAQCDKHIGEILDALREMHPQDYATLLPSVNDTNTLLESNIELDGHDMPPDRLWQFESIREFRRKFAALKARQRDLEARLDHFEERVRSTISISPPVDDKKIGELHAAYRKLDSELYDVIIPAVRHFFRDATQEKTMLAHAERHLWRHYNEKKFYEDYMAGIDATSEPIDRLKEEFRQANASADEASAASAATRYLRKAYGKGIIVSTPRRQPSGCWLFSYRKHQLQPMIFSPAILFPDGQYERCNWDSLTRFIKSEYAGPLSNDDIERIFRIVEKQKNVGNEISREKDIPDYARHPMTPEQLKSLDDLPEEDHFESRLYYSQLGGLVSRVTISLTPSNTVERVTGKSIADGIGNPEYYQ